MDSLLRGVAETPWEIANRTGEDIRDVCEYIERMLRDGRAVAVAIKCRDWSIPAFRLRQAWDKEIGDD